MSRIMLVDRDATLTTDLAVDLAVQGFEVEVCASGDRALDRAMSSPPDLVLLDVDLPGVDGVEVVRRVRAHPPTSSLPMILVSDRGDSTAKVLGLTAGADDYVVKPFDTLELMARVRGTLRRNAENRALSPLTGLHGNFRIQVEIDARAAREDGYAVCHLDLDDFKGFNDAYGFQRGDELILLLADCLHRAALAAPGPAPFLGHIGGDDFVVVCTPEQAEPLCRGALSAFDQEALPRYDLADAARGWLEVKDRRGVLQRVPIVSVSVGIASDADGHRDPRAVIAAATEMKAVAKSLTGSQIALDRRS